MNLDDPKLTAYAAGELHGQDRAQIELMLQHNHEARQIVKELRATMAVLRDEFAAEISPGLDDARREAITDPPRQRRNDVYRVITHPVADARRYRASLLAVAASVAIVATSITLVLSNRSKDNQSTFVATDPAPQPTNPIVFPPMANRNSSSSQLPELPDVTENITAHDLISMLPGGELDRSTFGVVSTVTLAPLPTTRPIDNATSGQYALTIENTFADVTRAPRSTFPFRVDTASYRNIRRALESKKMPAKEDVRIEQLVNYFPYEDTVKADDRKFAARIEVAACPWENEHRLVRISLKADPTNLNAAAKLIGREPHIDVEFNPTRVAAYRLIGYDRHIVSRPPPKNAPNDAIFPGQTVTALYELIPVSDLPLSIDPLKYQKPAELTAAAHSPEMFTVKMKYLDAAGAVRTEEFAALDRGQEASPNFKFAAAVASFGMLLRESAHKGTAGYDMVLALAEEGKGPDPLGERAKFIDLVHRAKEIAMN